MISLLRRFAGLNVLEDMVSDESSILRFRHLLKKHDLAIAIIAEVNEMLSEKGLEMTRGTAVDVALIVAPSSTKNLDKQCDPEMRQTKNGTQWHFVEGAIDVDAESALVHTVKCNRVCRAGRRSLGFDAGQVVCQRGVGGSTAGLQLDAVGRSGSCCASLPSGETAVWMCEGSLSWSGEEHGALLILSCAGKFVDGGQTIGAHGARSLGKNIGFQRAIGRKLSILDYFYDGSPQNNPLLRESLRQ